jgi:hypothetical protein
MHEYGLKTYCHNHVCTKRMCTAHSDKKVLNTKVKLINKTADCYSPKFHLLEIDRKFLVLECGAWLVIVPPEHPKGHQWAADYSFEENNHKNCAVLHSLSDERSQSNLWDTRIKHADKHDTRKYHMAWRSKYAGLVLHFKSWVRVTVVIVTRHFFLFEQTLHVISGWQNSLAATAPIGASSRHGNYKPDCCFEINWGK